MPAPVPRSGRRSVRALPPATYPPGAGVARTAESARLLGVGHCPLRDLRPARRVARRPPAAGLPAKRRSNELARRAAARARAARTRGLARDARAAHTAAR